MVLRSYTSRILMAATLASSTLLSAQQPGAGGASGRGARCARCGTRRRPGRAAGQVS